MEQMKPDYPFRRGTLIWKVCNGDWEDLTPAQIAEVLDSTEKTVRQAIFIIKRKTGYDVPRVREKRGRKPGIGVSHEKSHCH